MDRPPRRKFLLYITAIGGAVICLTVAFYRQILSFTYHLFAPRVVVRPASLIDAGPLSDYREPGVYTGLKAYHMLSG